MNGKFVPILLGLTWVLICGPPLRAADEDTASSSPQALRAFQQLYPQTRLHRSGANIERVYGSAFGGGASARDSAEQFRLEHAGMFGVDGDDLEPVSLLPDGRHTRNVMVDASNKRAKFTLVYYTQHHQGIPVFRSDLRLLVRNVPGYPLVLAASALKDLGDFTIPADLRDRPARPETIQDGLDIARQVVQAAEPALVSFEALQVVIWPGENRKLDSPRVALTIAADNAPPNGPGDQKWLLVTDINTGEVLYRENRIMDVDVTGNVSAMATTGVGSEQCEFEELRPMPDARVSIASTLAYTDMDGDFVIPNGGSSAVTVESTIRGLWFRVFNFAGSDAALSELVIPPGPANFVHNADNSDPLRRAEANAYIEANAIRDMVIIHSPDYPTLQDSQFEVWVNRTGGLCPGNAWYDDTVPSINFCQAGAGYPNTAWSSVIHHEYGHHLVKAAGSGQGQYGEGTGDVMSVIMLDDPRLGLGFFGDCASSLRNADNSYQYPCSGAIHDCGNLYSGCVWDTRNELVLNEPQDYLDILRNLAVNATLLHSGNLITPTITIDWLTLDDNDGDLENGTPHSEEILAGFGAHNMIPLPPPENDDCAEAIEACSEALSGSTTSATNDGTSTCGTSGGSPDVWYSYTPTTDGVATFSLCSGTSYDAVLSVHTGCPGGSANDLGCDDDFCAAGGPSQVTLNVTAGNTYIIRVTGWSGSIGNFTLNITGPNCASIPLFITFPDGVPESMEPGQPTVIKVLIEDGAEALVVDSAVLNYRYDGGSYISTPLTALGGGLYDAILPATDCAAVPEFYISAEGSGGSVRTNPINAPQEVHTSLMGTLTVSFEDDFQGDHGWTVTNGGGLLDGAWDRGVPVGGGDRGDPASDADGSGQCYLTDNVDDNSDVDNGYTILTSPVMDASGGEALLSYSRWFSNDFGDGAYTDTFDVEVSDDGGQSWQMLESVGPSGPEVSGGWFARAFILNDLAGFTPNDQFQVRFTAQDGEPQSVIEAAVDGVRLSILQCGGACPADFNGDAMVDAADLAALLGAWGPCPGCPVDLGGDGTVDAGDLAQLLGSWGACP